MGKWGCVFAVLGLVGGFGGESLATEFQEEGFEKGAGRLGFAVFEVGDNGGVAGSFVELGADGFEAFGSGFFERVNVGLELGFEDVLVDGAEAAFCDPEGGGGDGR